VGHHGDPAGEVVRFRARTSLDFPPSQLFALARAEDSSRPPELEVAFMGLTGPLGVLPQPYTELLVERTRYKDTALRDFLDIFNHRAVSFFYRAWEKYRFAIAFERGRDDVFTRALFATVGLGTRGAKNRLSVPDETVVYYGGIVAQRPRSASAIRAVLSDHFGVPVGVEQFTGQWLALEDSCLTRLGVANSRLGFDTIAGRRVWDLRSKFRLVAGPLTLEEFVGLLPPRENFRPLVDFTRFLVGDELDFDVQLVLAAKEVPACELASGSTRQPKLGWTTWLKTEEFAHDDSQVVLSTAVRGT
jgi:type VI secretion system protein ImpH